MKRKAHSVVPSVFASLLSWCFSIPLAIQPGDLSSSFNCNTRFGSCVLCFLSRCRIGKQWNVVPRFFSVPVYIQPVDLSSSSNCNTRFGTSVLSFLSFCSIWKQGNVVPRFFSVPVHIQPGDLSSSSNCNTRFGSSVLSFLSCCRIWKQWNVVPRFFKLMRTNYWARETEFHAFSKLYSFFDVLAMQRKAHSVVQSILASLLSWCFSVPVNNQPGDHLSSSFNCNTRFVY